MLAEFNRGHAILENCISFRLPYLFELCFMKLIFTLCYLLKYKNIKNYLTFFMKKMLFIGENIKF